MQGSIGPVNNDDLGRTQRRQHLNADVAQAASANYHRVFARQQVARGLLGSAVGGQTGVGKGRHVLGRQRLGQLDQRALAGTQVLGITAVGIDTGEAAVLRVHVVAAPTGQAVAAGHQRMADHRITHLHTGHRRAHGFDPAGVLVAHDVGQFDLRTAAPNALHHMQIGAADSRAADAHDNVGRALNLGVRNIFVTHE